MKIIAFIGTPKRDRHTMTLVNEVAKNINGDVEIINVYDYLHVKPCIDCGYCVKKPGCAIKDDFQEILDKIEEADGFIIASPMWFGTISGPMMSFFSRLQTISCGLIFRKDITHKWDKMGIFIMTAGSKWHSMMKSVETTAEFIFSHLDSQICDFIYATSTDKLPAKENKQALIRCKLAAQRMNDWYEDKSEGIFYKYGYSSVTYLKPEDME